MTNKTEVTAIKTLSLAEAAKVELTPENVMATYPLETLTSLKGRRAFELFSNVELLKPYIDAIHTESTSTIYNFAKKTEHTACGSAARKVSSSRKAITEAIDHSIKLEQDKVNQAKAAKKFVETEMNKTRDAVLAPRVVYDAEQAQIEQDRIDEIQGRIESIRQLGTVKGDESKEALGAMVDAVTEMTIDESFAEFAGTANEAKQEALNNLNDAIFAIAEKEQQEATRLALEAEQKKATIEGRINKLKQTPLALMGKTAKEISAKVESIKGYEPTAEDFDDRLTETIEAKAQVVQQLEFMLQQATQMEQMQREAEERRQADEQAQREAEEAEERERIKQAAAVEQAQTFEQPQPEVINTELHTLGNPEPEVIKTIVESTPESSATLYSNQLSEEDAPMYHDVIADAPESNVVVGALAEVCDETKQAEAAKVLIELTGGELSESLAIEVVGLIYSGVIPNLSFS